MKRKKVKNLLGGILLMALCLGAGNIPSKAAQTIDTSQETKQVFNNGGLYVEYKGDVYYRKYTANNYESTGIFGNFESVPNMAADMMRIKQDGTKEVAFRDMGYGNIYICNDRMYLENESTIYSVNLDGSNRKEFGAGHLKGFDEQTQSILCVLMDENYTNHLAHIDGNTGNLKEYDLTIPCEEFLAINQGKVYYRGKINQDDSEKGKVKLCSVNMDGSNEKLIAETNPDLYDFYNFGTTIPCIQFVGDTIYFSYGAYAGSANVYQGGIIAKVQRDGQNLTPLLGKPGAEDAIEENFYVSTENGKEVLHYSNWEENKALDLKTGQIQTWNFPVYAQDIPFEYNEGVSVYRNQSSNPITWIPYVDYHYLGLTKKADNYTVDDIQLCDNWVYYRLEASNSAPEASIGWRDGYRRVKTAVLRQKLGSNTAEVLFEY